MDTFKYLIHLKEGDIVKINGLPCQVFGTADLGTNTNPETFDIPYEYEEVPDEELI